jgi:hypothetical protein
MALRSLDQHDTRADGRQPRRPQSPIHVALNFIPYQLHLLDDLRWSLPPLRHAGVSRFDVLPSTHTVLHPTYNWHEDHCVPQFARRTRRTLRSLPNRLERRIRSRPSRLRPLIPTAHRVDANPDRARFKSTRSTHRRTAQSVRGATERLRVRRTSPSRIVHEHDVTAAAAQGHKVSSVLQRNG